MFYVPEVVNLDSERGIIEFERIVHLRTIQDLATQHDDRLMNILERAGSSLAIVHERLALPDDMRSARGGISQSDSPTNAPVFVRVVPHSRSYSTTPLQYLFSEYGSIPQARD